MRAHTNLAQGLKIFSSPSPEFFSSAVTFCPDMSLKTVTGSGGVISTALCLRMGRRDGDEGGGGVGMRSWSWTTRINSAFGSCNLLLWHYGSSLILSPLVSLQAQGLLVVFFLQSHMSRRSELDHELNHISAAWMSWMCAEPQTVGYQIRTQGLFFHSTSYHLSHPSHPFLSASL